MSNSVSIHLFGYPEIRLAGNPLYPKLPKKVLALLGVVALAERPVAREKLTALLWPDAPARAAQSSLRSALTVLRKACGPLLERKSMTLSLRQEALFVDVVAFQNGLANLAAVPRGAGDGQRTQAELAAWQATLDLYRGDFFDGLHVTNTAPFEEWLTQQREYLRQTMLSQLAGLVDAYAASGEPEKALQSLTRLLTLEPWSEAAYGKQMQLLAAMGRRSEALRCYELCCAMLEEEFGALPSPELATIHAEILANKIPLRSSGRPGAVVLSHKDVAVHPLRTMASHAVCGDAQLSGLASTPHPSAIPTNLIYPLRTFVGRQSVLAYALKQIAQPTCRLLTIMGPGGMGKTALAEEMGQRLLAMSPTSFPDGIFWVSLADVDITSQGEVDPMVTAEAVMGEAIVRAITEALSTQPEVRIASIQQLHAYVRTRRLLLILDNLEHLLEGVNALVTLLTQAPHIKIIATSRSRLKLRGETIVTLKKLSLPASDDSLPEKSCLPSSAVRMGQNVSGHRYHTAHTTNLVNSLCTSEETWQESEALAMFVQRAQQLDLDFVLNAETIGPVTQICHLVEGLPLGIELATSMLPLLSCAELAAALTESLDVLETDMRDVPHEQRTLAAVFEHSWRLLPPNEQQLLAQLAIFPGSFRRDAAQAITGATTTQLKRLVDHSLVRKADAERFTLHHTIHAFAHQKLHRWPELAATLAAQYVQHYLARLADLEQEITGATYRQATEQIRMDLHNFHTAWQQAIRDQRYRPLNDSLTAFLLYYDQQGFYLDALSLYHDALSHLQRRNQEKGNGRATDSLLNLLQGRLQTLIGFYHIRLGQLQEAECAYQASAANLQQQDDPAASALCFSLWGGSLRASNPQQSVMLLLKALSLAQVSNTTWLQVITVQLLGETNLLLGNYALAKTQIAEGLTLAKQIGWPRGMTSGNKDMALIHLMQGDYRQAEKQFQSAADLARQHHLQMLYVESTLLLGTALRLQERFVEGESCFVEGRKLAETLGAAILMVPVLWEEGCLAEQRGDYLIAKTHLTKSLLIGLPNWWAHVLPTLGWVHISLGELAEAHTYFQDVVTKANVQQCLPISLDAQAGLAYIALLWAKRGQMAAAPQTEIITHTTATLQQIHQHPAATQQTRDRIAQLNATIKIEDCHCTQPFLLEVVQTT